MYKELKNINKRPELYERYTAKELWVDDHRSEQMLKYHLNKEIDVSSNREEYIEESVGFMLKRFGLDMKKSIIDFGCGPGLYTNRLAKYTRVTGIDFSENSINYAVNTARENNLEVEYLLGDYLEADLDKKYDLITMIMFDFCALTRDQRKKLLSKFRSILKEGGSIFFDVLSGNSYHKKDEAAFYEHRQLGGFWSALDYYAFVNTFKYEDEMVVLDKYTIIEESKTYEVYNWLKHYTLEDIKKELEEAGLTVEDTYSDMTGREYTEDSDTIAVIAKG